MSRAWKHPKVEQGQRRRFGLLLGLAVVLYIGAVIVFIIGN